MNNTSNTGTETSNTGFVDVPTAVAAFKAGEIIVIIDDEDRENEGDLCIAAEHCTPEAINFMAKFGRGLICLTLTEERADYMRLSPMTQANTSRFGTAFTESIEAREGVTTGISAADRARTIRVAISPNSSPNDLARPGHIFPLRARKGGVLVRAGQTEASVDFARLAGLIPAGVICEIMNDDGTMARVADLLIFCQTHSLKMVTVADLIRYRMANERYVHRVGVGELPTAHGNFKMVAYESAVEGGESHIALTFGDLSAEDDTPILVRVHTHCLAGNLFGSTACDCRATVDASLKAIAEAGRGALVYLHHTQRGYTIDKAFDPPALCIHRADRSAEGSSRRAEGSAPPDQQRILRQVGLGGQILSDLGIRRIRLLTNQPTHVPALQGFGIEIVERVPIALQPGSLAR
jgi:3,4-dihydroxy 2-butanone 4-phosphate synthase/GTP cyclohydrolase II